MNIASLCHRDVVAIASDASPREAATLMCEEHVGALVVVSAEDPPSVVGVVTDRDLALEVVGRPDAPTLRVGHLAKSPPVAVQGSATMQEAVALMDKAGVRRLLVVDDEGGVIGLVAAEDLMAAISEELGTLARALRSGISREKGERKVFSSPRGVRPVFPLFGVAAVQ
jgi:CBS domain-containing protein